MTNGSISNGTCLQQQQQQQPHLYFLHKYTSITPPSNSKANRGRWCEDGLKLITIVGVKKKKKYHIYNKGSVARVIEIGKSRQLFR